MPERIAEELDDELLEFWRAHAEVYRDTSGSTAFDQALDELEEQNERANRAEAKIDERVTRAIGTELVEWQRHTSDIHRGGIVRDILNALIAEREYTAQLEARLVAVDQRVAS